MAHLRDLSAFAPIQPHRRASGLLCKRVGAAESRKDHPVKHRPVLGYAPRTFEILHWQIPEAFTAHGGGLLAPTPRPGDIVIMDNLPAHRVGVTRAAIERTDARLPFVPPYSPDFNPIEQAIAKIKALLRKAAVRTLEALDAATAAALDTFPPDECANYFTNSGCEPD